MSRQQRRAAERNAQKAKVKTYNLTEEQLNQYVADAVKSQCGNLYEEMKHDAVNEAMVLLLGLPLKVLMDHYWKKSYAKRIPEFTSHVLEYYQSWENGELDMDKLRAELWDYGGVRLEVK